MRLIPYGLILIWLGVAQANVNWPKPPGGDGPSEDYQQGYQDGYNQGVQDGKSQGYDEGYQVGYDDGKKDGYDQGQADCRQDPKSCQIKLEDMIGNLGYGETEPNDSMVNADELTLGTFYHGNSYDTYDYDWYVIKVDQSNQNLLINFMGDPADLTNTAGWILEVRDVYGNVIAAFNTAMLGDATNPPDNGGGDTGGGGGDTTGNAKEGDLNTPDWPLTDSRAMVVTLGNPGNYYIAVKPFLKEVPGQDPTTDGSWRAYNIAASISDSGMTNDNPDSNFYDVETEPNDTVDTADQIHSNVHMFAVFTKIPNRYQDADGKWHLGYSYDEEWFRFDSNGNEILTFSMCAKGGCSFPLIHLIIQAPDGTHLYDGPVSPGFVHNIGLAQSGTYYINLTPEVINIDSETGAYIVSDAFGSYNFVMQSTGLNPNTRLGKRGLKR